MNPQPREVLCRIIQDHGPTLAADANRCEALLRDLCGGHRKELFVLVAACRARVPADLSQAGAMPELAVAKATTRLVEELGFREDVARWAVLSWALALGVLDPSVADRLKAGGAPEAVQSPESEKVEGKPETETAPALKPEAPTPAASVDGRWTWGAVLFAFFSVLLAIHPVLWVGAVFAGVAGWLVVRSRQPAAAPAIRDRLSVVLPVAGILVTGIGALFIDQMRRTAQHRFDEASGQAAQAAHERALAEETRRQAELERKRARPVTISESGAAAVLPTLSFHPSSTSLFYPVQNLYVFAVLDNALYGEESGTVSAEIELTGPERFGPWTRSQLLLPSTDRQMLISANWKLPEGRLSFSSGDYHYVIKVNGTAQASGDFTISGSLFRRQPFIR